MGRIFCATNDKYTTKRIQDEVVESYRQLSWDYGHGGVARLGEPAGDCFNVVALEPGTQEPFFGDNAIALDKPMEIHFHGQPVWGVYVYLVALAHNPDRHPHLQCYDIRGNPTGGDTGGAFGGPHNFLNMYYNPWRDTSNGRLPEPIARCTIDPGVNGDGVLLPWLSSKSDLL